MSELSKHYREEYGENLETAFKQGMEKKGYGGRFGLEYACARFEKLLGQPQQIRKGKNVEEQVATHVRNIKILDESGNPWMGNPEMTKKAEILIPFIKEMDRLKKNNEGSWQSEAFHQYFLAGRALGNVNGLQFEAIESVLDKKEGVDLDSDLDSYLEGSFAQEVLHGHIRNHLPLIPVVDPYGPSDKTEKADPTDTKDVDSKEKKVKEGADPKEKKKATPGIMEKKVVVDGVPLCGKTYDYVRNRFMHKSGSQWKLTPKTVKAKAMYKRCAMALATANSEEAILAALNRFVAAHSEWATKEPKKVTPPKVTEIDGAAKWAILGAGLITPGINTIIIPGMLGKVVNAICGQNISTGISVDGGIAVGGGELELGVGLAFNGLDVGYFGGDLEGAKRRIPMLSAGVGTHTITMFGGFETWNKVVMSASVAIGPVGATALFDSNHDCIGFSGDFGIATPDSPIQVKKKGDVADGIEGAVDSIEAVKDGLDARNDAIPTW